MKTRYQIHKTNLLSLGSLPEWTLYTELPSERSSLSDELDSDSNAEAGAVVRVGMGCVLALLEEDEAASTVVAVV